MVTDFGRRFEHATSVAIQANGTILVGGSVTDGANESWAFARYLGDRSSQASRSTAGARIGVSSGCTPAAHATGASAATTS
jgi:hypothetical protein